MGSASRVQVPLGLAWAITVHKSQGMSIDRLVVSLADVFAARPEQNSRPALCGAHS